MNAATLSLGEKKEGDLTSDHELKRVSESRRTLDESLIYELWEKVFLYRITFWFDSVDYGH